MNTRPNTSSPSRSLRVYDLAQRLAVAVHRSMAALPRGHADLRDQARRAAQSVVRNVAEGAGRFAPADKRARFRIALGELFECESCLDTASLLGVLTTSERDSMLVIGASVRRMLTALVRTQERRLRERESG